MTEFFKTSLRDADPVIANFIDAELKRQQGQIELIASENIVSQAVLDAAGSVLTNKYAEGYPGKRYYQGCVHIDSVEQLAIDRACELFGCSYANVQPHSGANANLAVLFALLKAGDKIMGLSLDAGGHLTHGAKPTISGKWFDAVAYGLHPETGNIDYDAAAELAKTHQPKLIICGGSAIPREVDWERFREIADSVGAYLMADMAHPAGLIAGGVNKSPIGIADVVTTTTHKTLRGPRGGLILTNNEEIAKKINKSVFPGCQGGPLEHIIAAKAVAFGEALQPSFARYAEQVKKNASVMADALIGRGYDLVSGGTDTHLMLVDLRKHGLTGKAADEALESVGLTCNKNGVPNDPLPPLLTSGIRLGSAAGTTRGFKEAEFRRIGNLIADVLDNLDNEKGLDPTIADFVKGCVKEITDQYPIY